MVTPASTHDLVSLPRASGPQGSMRTSTPAHRRAHAHRENPVDDRPRQDEAPHCTRWWRSALATTADFLAALGSVQRTHCFSRRSAQQLLRRSGCGGGRQCSCARDVAKLADVGRSPEPTTTHDTTAEVPNTSPACTAPKQMTGAGQGCLVCSVQPKPKRPPPPRIAYNATGGSFACTLSRARRNNRESCSHLHLRVVDAALALREHPREPVRDGSRDGESLHAAVNCCCIGTQVGRTISEPTKGER